MQNLLSRRSGPALVIAALAAIVIGCGGGGGGGGSNGTDGSTNATNGNTDAGTLTNGSSAGTDGGVGALPQDSIFYVQADQGTAYNVKYTKADGTGQGTYASGVANDSSPMVANPAAAGEFVFAAIPAGSTTYGIYRNTTNSTIGATVVVAPRYSSVSSLQISRDGTRIVYIATTGDVNTAPFRLVQSSSAPNSTPTDIDEADSASLSSAGDRVVYSKFPSDADNDTELYIRTLAQSTSVRLTNNSLYDEQPQFSKIGDIVVFSQQVPSTNRYRLASVNLTTAAVTTLDPVPGLEQQSSPSLNASANRISFIGRSNGAASESGLYVADFPSGANATQVVSAADLSAGTYWSTPLGRSFAGDTLRLSIPRKR